MMQHKYCFQQNFGISLVEVVVVLVVFSLLMVMAAPLVDGFRQRQKLRSTLRSIAALLHNSRFAALKINAPVVVEISSDSCHAFLDNGEDGHARNWIQDDGEKSLANITVESGLKLTNTCNKTSHPNKFRYTGRLRVSPCSIIVTSAEGDKGKVVINAVGRVRIEVSKK